MSTSVPTAERCGRAAGGGVLGGFIASVPALASVVTALCFACVGGGVTAGAGIGLARWPFVLVGGVALFVSIWVTDRRARPYLAARQRLRSAALTVAVAGATAVATYLVVNVALVTAVRIAMQGLFDAFAH